MQPLGEGHISDMATKQSDSAPELVRFVGPVIDALTTLGGSGRPEEVRSAIAKAMNVSEEEQAQLLPSGVQSRLKTKFTGLVSIWPRAGISTRLRPSMACGRSRRRRALLERSRPLRRAKSIAS